MRLDVYYRNWGDSEKTPSLVATFNHPDTMSDEEACEAVFKKLNIDYPEGWENRSMSVGDFIIIDDSRRALCESLGFSIEPWDETVGFIPEGEPKNYLDLYRRTSSITGEIKVDIENIVSEVVKEVLAGEDVGKFDDGDMEMLLDFLRGSAEILAKDLFMTTEKVYDMIEQLAMRAGL